MISRNSRAMKMFQQVFDSFLFFSFLYYIIIIVYLFSLLCIFLFFFLFLSNKKITGAIG